MLTVVIIILLAVIVALAVVSYQTRRFLHNVEAQDKFVVRPAIIFINEQSIVTRWDKHAMELFGWSEQEAIGRSLAFIIPDRYHQQHLAGMAKMERTGTGAIINKLVKLEGLHKDRSEFDMYLLVFKSHDERGERNYIGRVWHAVDIEN